MGFLWNKCQHKMVKQYQDNGPKLCLEQYLSAHLTGTGIIQTWSGKVASQFDFSADGSWQGDTGTLDESMVYYNGKTDHRVWSIRRLAPGQYVAETSGIIGQATICVAGNAMNWRYTMDVEVNNKVYRLNFDDWMFLMHDDRLININCFKKFGLTVGSLTLCMEKQS